jgi:tRNA pseudouridine38-40 synthase
MPRTLKLVLAYDGTDFHGWQSQAGVRTVQGAAQEAIQRVVRHPVDLVGASRTDAGVHARGQVAHLTTSCTIPERNLLLAIGHRLPQDVALVSLEAVPDGFHAIRDARCKLYRYTIYNSPQRPVLDLCQRYTWHFWHALDIEAMRQAAESLVGTHDFAAFASSGHGRNHTVRTVRRIELGRRGPHVWIDVEGDGFLYNQVRNMVGTLVEIGRGRWPVQRAAEALASRDRRQAGPTAPAHGLCLEWVCYKDS